MERVLHIIASLEPGDIPEQLRLLALGMPREEFELHVCALRGGPMAEPLRAAGMKVAIVPQRLWLDPRTIQRLRSHIEALKPAVVQTWEFDANTHGRIAAWQEGVPRLVAVERGFDAWKRWPQRLIDRRLAPRTARVVISSPSVEPYYRQRGVHPERYAVIPDGVERIVADPQARRELLVELELDPSTCLIGAVGALGPQNRFKDFIWAMDILHYLYPGAHLLIVGDGPQRVALMRYADCVEVSDRIHFLGHRKDAAQVVACLDVLWHSAVQDAAALPVLQAQAAAVPVIAIDTEPHREMISHGDTGFLVTVGDRPDIARWTHRMLEDSALKQRIAAAGQQRTLKDNTADRLVENYQRLYRELVQGH